MHRISLVNDPAIEENFIHFNKEEGDVEHLFLDEEKRQVVGPIMVPEKLIFRKHPTIGGYYVRFTKEVIEEIMMKYTKEGKFNLFNVAHEGEQFDGVTMLEVWIKEFDNDKSNAYGYDLPVGTAFVKAYIENDMLWDDIKNGEINGFSIEINSAIKQSNFEQMSEFAFAKELGKMEANFETLITNLSSQIEDLTKKLEEQEEQFAVVKNWEERIKVIEEQSIKSETDDATGETTITTETNSVVEETFEAEEAEVEEATEEFAEVEAEAETEVEEQLSTEETNEEEAEEEFSSEEAPEESAAVEEAELALSKEQDETPAPEGEPEVQVFERITSNKVEMVNGFFNRFNK